MDIIIKITQVADYNGCPSYMVEYAENGNRNETAITVVGSTVNYSNDKLPECVMDCVEELIGR